MLLQSDCELSNTSLNISFLKKELLFTDESVEIPNGNAFEVRIYAENPTRDFAPSPGILHYISFPVASPSTEIDFKIRIDHWN